jgi:Protein of unknown function (DUF3040)
MLSDAEQRRLTEIERALRSEDPEFVHRFGDVMQPTPRNRSLTTPRNWLIAAALIMGSAVLMASVALAVVGLSVAAASIGLWITEPDSPPDDRKPPPR